MIDANPTASTTGIYSKFFQYAQDEYILMNFPLAAAQGLAGQQATLSVFIESASTDTQLRFYNSAPGAATLHQNQRYGTTIHTFSQGSPGWLDVDVTSQIETALNNGWDWVAFSIIRQDDGYVATARMSEFGTDDTYTPRVVVAPEPAAAALLGVGGLMLAVRRRR